MTLDFFCLETVPEPKPSICSVITLSCELNASSPLLLIAWPQPGLDRQPSGDQHHVMAKVENMPFYQIYCQFKWQDGDRISHVRSAASCQSRQYLQ